MGMKITPISQVLLRIKQNNICKVLIQDQYILRSMQILGHCTFMKSSALIFLILPPGNQVKNGKVEFYLCINLFINFPLQIYPAACQPLPKNSSPFGEVSRLCPGKSHKIMMDQGQQVTQKDNQYKAILFLDRLGLVKFKFVKSREYSFDFLQLHSTLNSLQRHCLNHYCEVQKTKALIFKFT